MMRISEAALALNVPYSGPDVEFTSVGADSRKILPGQLFVALKGEHFDGHDFVVNAFHQGAAAVLVSQRVETTLPAIVVEDTYAALGKLAAYWRSKFFMPIAGVTGSSGKTTVKEMLAAILRAAATEESVLATQGNLNNHIGLPMTLFKLNANHRFAVIEMGMNHSGEIAYLTKLTRPDVALINNAGSAHIGELGSLEAIAKAKGEIFEGLSENGIAVINADDQFAPLWKALIGPRKTITFGLHHRADVSARYSLRADSSLLTLQTPDGSCELELTAPGLHNVMNALAATATALAMGVQLDAVSKGLQAYAGVKGRLQVLKGIHDATVIDDTYNANPISMKAAIDVLKAKTGKKILVLGDMGELGNEAENAHKDIGVYAKAAGADALLTLGDHSALMTKGFGQGAQHYTDIDALVADLVRIMQPGSTVLVKGSRFMAMERVVGKVTASNGTDKHIRGAH
jgi:UDP-N-acetylmuramoyl-tripeptide--D-alanyl-D-alanine ligase